MKLYVLLISLIFVLQKRCLEFKLLPLSEDGIMRTTSLAQCVTKISKLYFTDHSKLLNITASFNGHVDVIFKYIETDIFWGLEVKYLKLTNYSSEHFIKANNYLIYIKDSYDLLPVLHTLKKVMSNNYYTKLIIISATIFKNPQKVASEIIDTLEREKVTKALILLPNKNNSLRYAVHRWHSYSKLAYDHTELPINFCSFGILDNYGNGISKVVTKCKMNCGIKAYYKKYPPYVLNAELGFQSTNYFTNQGFEINLLNMVSDHMNLTVQYSESKAFWGDIYDNGTITGDLRLLLNRSADVLLGGYSKTELRDKYFDLTIPYIHDYMIWCVPHVIISQFRNFVNIFTVNTWILINLVYLLFSVCIWVLSLFSIYECPSYKTFTSVLFYDFAVLLNVPLNTLPRNSQVRCVMTLFILFAFMTTLVYTSCLTSIVSTPRYKQKYNSMKDICHYNLTTYMTPNAISRFTDDFDVLNDIHVSLIKKKWISCYNSSQCLEKVANSDSYAFCIIKLNKDYFIRTREIPVYCMNENIVIFYINMVMRKGFPHGELFNVMINRIISAGFLSKWMKDILQMKPKWNYFESEKFSITFKHLKPFFKVFAMCTFFTFIVFLGELWF